MKYHLETETPTILTNEVVNTMFYGLTNLWFNVADTVFSYNAHGFNPYHVEIILPQASSIATAITETSDHMLYIATSNCGLIQYNQNKKIVNQWDINHVISLFQDSKKNIWACTRYDGLFKIDFNNTVTNYKHDVSVEGSLPDNFVRTICEDDNGNYWVGHFKGLAKLDVKTDKFNLIEFKKGVPYGISNTSVWDIMKDHQGTIWIGTYNGGVNLYNPKYSIFTHYGPIDSDNSLNGSVIGQIVEDELGNLWIGADGGGLNFLNRETNTFTSYQANSKTNSLSVNYIKTMWLDKKNETLWLGTHMGGLNKMDIKTGYFKHFKNNLSDSLSIPSNNIRKIVHYNDTLFIATQNYITKFDIKKEQFTTLKLDSLKIKQAISDLFLDSKNKLWFAAENKIYVLDLISYKFSFFQTNRKVNFFYEDSNQRLWIGTSGEGVNYFNESTQTIEPEDKINNLLSSEYIIDFKESKGGYYYIATNNDLNIIDTNLQNLRVFNHANGFPLEALNENSIFISNSNEIFVGGINGMVSFFEKNLDIPKPSYSVVLSDIHVNNKKVHPTKNGIISKTPVYLDKITLKSKHTTVSLFFTTTNFINLLKTDIEYKLEGFDKDWIKAGVNKSVTYTNLNPGKYIFRLRGTSRISEGTFPEKSISIHVFPPFYKTSWAYSLYVLIILLITYTILRFYTEKIKLSTTLEYEKREKEHLEDLSNSKLSFFTNISHEFRTPLTLIANYVEQMLQATNVPQNIYNKLLNVLKNTNRMKSLITELVEFRKYEQGSLQLSVSENDIIPFLNEIFLSFKELAYSMDIEYSFFNKEQEILLWFDKNQLDKVFYNLLSNAFKYTPPKGKITLQIEHHISYIIISVIDTGIGIDKQQHNQIFDRFYQVDNNSHAITESGSGIGLALAKGIVKLHHGEISVISEPKKGSKFSVHLQLGGNHFTEDQKNATNQLHQQLVQIKDSQPDLKFIEEIRTSQIATNASDATILIVEDNIELLNMLVEIFSPIYKVLTALNGQDGIETAIKKQPDIILSDVMMPIMSGIEMCSKLKQNFETSHIPIILLTARTAPDYMVQGLLTGADDYIIKPFNQKVLITRCNNLVNLRKSLQRRFTKQLDELSHTIATNPTDQQFLEKAFKVVEENINNSNFNVNVFAAEMFLSRTNLFTKLRGITGQTPNEFISNIRLKKSLHYLLHNQEMSIADIAFQVGFSSTSYFIKKFCLLYGETPARYRKTQRE